ncbi:hypothetical protein C7S18_10965 [Ahniella affigens]|uniref:Uncharacterized protein n=1 Tax=Ahniella affigens TaxID=2021234 RepID=A0A2P1PS68_9GAMM|nr:DUF1295 domain-containing protein [Ahniella affigens]AVP97689.1 hypothetical protein C7S18_10965 [Ahniella affigens]
MIGIALIKVLLLAVLVMTAIWYLQMRTRNAGFVDVAWALLLGVSALYLSLAGTGEMTWRIALALCGGFWGFRLGLHLLHRVLHEEEDGRYRFLREHWHGHQGKFFGFFMAQAVLVLVFALPFAAVAWNEQRHSLVQVGAALAIWFLAMFGEAIADRQLAHFRSHPANKGKTCRVGLWRYSRHPNYFFEWLHWFTYVVLSIGSPYWYFSIFGLVAMGVSLNWITGIPYVEAQALRSRGDDYRAYQRTTNSFFPWFPKQDTP